MPRPLRPARASSLDHHARLDRPLGARRTARPSASRRATKSATGGSERGRGAAAAGWPPRSPPPSPRGGVIPAHPLALTAERRLDERRQRALSRYYIDAGAVGLAVGVHTTQFAIRDPGVGLLSPVLALAARGDGSGRRRPARAPAPAPNRRHLRTDRPRRWPRPGWPATSATTSACSAWRRWPGPSDDELLRHARAVGEVLPLMGFYLQPAVGGRLLGARLLAPALRAAQRCWPSRSPPSIATRRSRCCTACAPAAAPTRSPFTPATTTTSSPTWSRRIDLGGDTRAALLRRPARPVGGLDPPGRRPGQRHPRPRRRRPPPSPHACSPSAPSSPTPTPPSSTPANRFRGCIPGIHETLRRQGLLAATTCLDPSETLSPGQLEEIDRIHTAYPHLRDDAFVAEHLDRWLA